MTFSSNGFCWAGSINARQKHKFPNGIIKLKLENYNSFLKYKLFPGLKKFLKEKEHNFKILNLYLKKLSTYFITVYIKGKGMHHWSQFSQPNVSKSNLYRKTNTNSSCTGVCRYHKYFKRKKLSINARYRLPVSPSTSPLVTLFARRGHPHSMHQHEKSQDAAHFRITHSLPCIITFGTHFRPAPYSWKSANDTVHCQR